MATHDYVIDNGTGSAVRADLNNLFKAILTNNSGTTDPSTVISSDAGSKAFSFWADTNSSPAVLKIRNAADDGWIELFQLDGTLTLEDGSASTPALAFRDDLNTGIYSSAADTFNVATGGVERMELGTTTIFNEDGADVDFRIEGDTEANLFYVNAGNESIGIGTSSPNSGRLHVTHSTGTIGYFESTQASSNVANIVGNSTQTDSSSNLLLQINSGTTAQGIIRLNGDNSIGIHNGATPTEKLKIDSSGNVGIGTSSPAELLHLQSTAGNTKLRLTQSGSTTDAVNGAIHFGNSTDGQLCEIRGYTSGSNNSGYLQFRTTNSGSDVTAMTIATSGDVGIGKTSPNIRSNSRALTVSNTGTAARSAVEIEGNTANCHGALDFINNGTLVSGLNSRGSDRLQFVTGSSGDVRGQFTSNGLNFGNDTAAANALNDYEEGTWTPIVHNPSGITLSKAHGQYRKIGKQVFAAFEITFPSTSGSDHLICKGLPFTSGNASQSNCGGVAKDYQTVVDTSDGPIYHIPQNNTQIQFYRDSGQNMTIGNVSGGNFRGVAIYLTD